MFKNNNLYVVVPHRGVNAGKSRLAAVLNDVARGKLNRWLLARTLRVVAAWLGDAKPCLVISPCEVTLALARKAGVTALPEPTGTPGLNAALALAAAHAASLGARRVLILPCDLPRLDVAALDALRAPADYDPVTVIAPDRHREGTNALLVESSVREFAFGANSLAQHVAQAEARGARVFTCINEALAFDLDTATDFAAWANSDDVPQDLLATLPRAVPACAGFVSSRTK